MTRSLDHRDEDIPGGRDQREASQGTVSQQHHPGILGSESAPEATSHFGALPTSLVQVAL